MVTVFCPLTTTDAGRLVLQTGEMRFVVDSKVNPTALVGHVKMKLPAERMVVSCGLNERLNTVPEPAVPPEYVVPYSVSRDKNSPACGMAPSLLVTEK